VSNRQLVRSRHEWGRTSRDVLDDALFLVAAGQDALHRNEIAELAVIAALRINTLSKAERTRLVAMLAWVAAAIASDVPDYGESAIERIRTSLPD
jgi:hypothetical protein